jgi:hypothetical protein
MEPIQLPNASDPLKAGTSTLEDMNTGTAESQAIGGVPRPVASVPKPIGDTGDIDGANQEIGGVPRPVASVPKPVGVFSGISDHEQRITFLEGLVSDLRKLLINAGIIPPA